VPGDTAIVRIDALFNATRCSVAEIERIADRYPGARGVRRLCTALDLADGGAESPKETELRLLLVRDGLSRPVTQIHVVKQGHKPRRVDMGWPQWKVGVEYDGEQHFSNPDDYADDIVRLEFLAAQGWIIVRVSSRQLRFDRAGIIRRVRTALELRRQR
jgi:very-short-patch-repair endonuclease